MDKNTKKPQPITRDQVRYFRERVVQLAKERVAKLGEGRQARYDRDAGDVLNEEIAAGRFQMPSKTALIASLEEGEVKYSTDLHKVLRFTRYKDGYEQAKKSLDDNDDGHRRRVKAVERARDEIIDKVMLGDAAEALASLKEFADKLERL